MGTSRRIKNGKKNVKMLNEEAAHLRILRTLGGPRERHTSIALLF